MNKGFRLPTLIIGGLLLGIVAIGLLQANSHSFFDGTFAPQGQCLLWDTNLLRTYTIADLLTGLSYAAISLILTYILYKSRRDLLFPWVFLAFGAFILFSGLTHFLDIITLWTPIYWTDASTKVLTAVLSVATAFALPPAVPRVLALVNAAKQSGESKHGLIVANQALESEISQRRSVEDELRAALEREHELNEFRRQFIIRMSHEFRTPLAIARTSSDLLKSYNGHFDEQQRADRLGRIQKQIEHMSDLLDDILSAGKFQAGLGEFKPAPTDLEALCLGLIAHPRSSSVTVEFRTDSPCQTMPLDAAQIERALANLLENAIDYSPLQGNVRFTLACDATQAIIRIEDEGMGIASEERERIFDYFYRGKNAADISGTGLGLSIARQIIELHGGTITLDAQRSVGSAFIVHLPLIEQPIP